MEQLQIDHTELRAEFTTIKEALVTVEKALGTIQSKVRTISNVDPLRFAVPEESQLLEQTIDVATGHIAQLKTRLNTLRSINKLPVELLIRIILLTTPSIKEKSHPYISYTGVCRHWRSVIIQNSDFWTLIQPAAIPFVHQVLQRSNSAKLDVIIQKGWSLQFVSALQGLFAEESHRIRTLQILAWTTELDVHLVSLVSSSTCLPALRSLVIPSYSCDVFRPLLPVLAFSDHLETLQCTLRDDIPLNQLAPIFRRLKNLSLSVCSDPVIIQSLLSNNTKLQTLLLNPSIRNGPMISWTILPELRFLSTESSPLLGHFRTPKLSGLDIYWGYPRVVTVNYPILEEFDFSSIRYLYIVQPDFDKSSYRGQCIMASKDRLHRESMFSAKAEYFDDYFLIPEDLDIFPRIGHDILLESFPSDFLRLVFASAELFTTALKPLLSLMLPKMTGLKELYFFPYLPSKDYERNWNGIHLGEIIAQVPSLDKLVVEHVDTLLDFIRLLRDTSLFPRLKHLSYSTYENPDPSDNFAEDVGKALTECLQSRHEAAVHELEFIALGECPPLPDTWLNELRKLGTRVVVQKGPIFGN